mmetsp:Transcript_26455/g.65713  ORF Transcript_26455/g.65713 Transcript_26455/m.65713 type:complete len:81 (+) Transcript_26455:136-378(+)
MATAAAVGATGNGNASGGYEQLTHAERRCLPACPTAFFLWLATSFVCVVWGVGVGLCMCVCVWTVSRHFGMERLDGWSEN